MNKGIVFLLIIFCSFSLTVLGQKSKNRSFHFTEWKGEFQVPTEKILIYIDSTDPDGLNVYLDCIATELKINFEKNNIECKLIGSLPTSEIDKRNICLKLQMCGTAYVKLNANPLDNKLIRCGCTKLIQIQPVTKKKIESNLYIPFDDSLAGMIEGPRDLAEKIIEYLKIEK
jgi:hypothetical protein